MHKKKSTPWARRRRRLYIACFVVILLLSPAVIWRLRVKSEMLDELAAIKALGVPMTAEEHETWEAQFPRPGVNESYGLAASAMVQLPIDVLEKFPSFRPRHDGDEIFAVPYSPETSAAMRTLVELNGEALRLLREGRSKAKPGLASGLERYRTTEDFVELCCAQACVAAESGDGALAADAILDGLAFLAAHYTRPWSSTPYSRGGEAGWLMRALASAAARVSLPDEKLAEMQGWLEAPNWEQDLRLSTIDYCAITLQQYEEHQELDPPARIAFTVFGVMDRQMTYVFREQRLYLESIGKPVSEQKAMFDVFRAEGGWRSFRFSGPPMESRVAMAGIELIRNYQKTGALPESLDVLAREGLDLEDFYSETQLGYKRDGATVRIYSVGQDLGDNGGDGRSDVLFQAVLPAR
ncbi:MAG: hypothetical protein JNK74_08365 [Candidatus Hydrogenedentes bacterium]|nr:hypothetical protein [Candidatus Hydrogenedentota bacterium]